jgi:hypothetical protein
MRMIEPGGSRRVRRPKNNLKFSLPAIWTKWSEKWEITCFILPLVASLCVFYYMALGGVAMEGTGFFHNLGNHKLDVSGLEGESRG